MSLTPEQIVATQQELQANLTLTGLSHEQVAKDLGISTIKLNKLLTLDQRSLNDPWILRNYLLEKVSATGQTPIPFTALSGDWHRHWFLDSHAIDNAQMTPGDD